jgi:hypothetical protein
VSLDVVAVCVLKMVLFVFVNSHFTGTQKVATTESRQRQSHKSKLSRSRRAALVCFAP